MQVHFEWPIKDFRNKLNEKRTVGYVSETFKTPKTLPPITWQMTFWPNGNKNGGGVILEIQLTSKNYIQVLLEDFYTKDEKGQNIMFYKRDPENYIPDELEKGGSIKVRNISKGRFIGGVEKDGTLVLKCNITIRMWM